MLSNTQIIWIAFFCGVYAGVVGFAVALIASNRTPDIQPTIEED